MSTDQRGLTLVEIMVVLVILAIVMATFGSRIFGAGDKAKANITRTQLLALKQSIEQFKLNYNTLPSGLTDLVQCTEITGQGCVPVTNEEQLKDGWGNQFVYSVKDGKRAYMIKSLGADGVDGGEEVNFDIFVEGP